MLDVVGRRVLTPSPASSVIRHQVHSSAFRNPTNSCAVGGIHLWGSLQMNANACVVIDPCSVCSSVKFIGEYMSNAKSLFPLSTVRQRVTFHVVMEKIFRFWRILEEEYRLLLNIRREHTLVHNIISNRSYDGQKRKWKIETGFNQSHSFREKAC